MFSVPQFIVDKSIDVNYPIFGVYMITCTANDKKYVGSAQDVIKRWVDHLRDLRLNKHFSRSMQNDWNTYYPISFVFTILEDVGKDKGVPHLRSREQFFMDTYNTQNKRKGYNIVNASSRSVKWERELKGVFWTITTPDLQVTVDVPDLEEFCKTYKLSYEHMLQVAEGSLPDYLGWKCRKGENI